MVLTNQMLCKSNIIHMEIQICHLLHQKKPRFLFQVICTLITSYQFGYDNTPRIWQINSKGLQLINDCSKKLPWKICIWHFRWEEELLLVEQLSPKATGDIITLYKYNFYIFKKWNETTNLKKKQIRKWRQ